MASARCAVFIKRAPSVAVPIRRLSSTTIQNTRSTFHVTPAKFNLQQRTKINNPLLLSSTKPLTFSRKFATSAKEYEEQITRHIQQNDFDAAETTFKTMREQKVNPSLPLLSSLIMEFSAAGKTDKSLEYYDVLRKLGYSPDEKILNIVVSSLSQKFKTSAKPKEAPAQPQQVVAPPKTENAVSQQIMDLQHTEQEEEVESTEIDGFEEEDLDLEGHLEEPINVNEEELTEHPIVIVHETGSNVFATATHQGISSYYLLDKNPLLTSAPYLPSTSTNKSNGVLLYLELPSIHAVVALLKAKLSTVLTYASFNYHQQFELPEATFHCFVPSSIDLFVNSSVPTFPMLLAPDTR